MGDIDTELNFHLEMRVAELVGQGLTPEEAARRAREEFGDVEFTRSYCRDVDLRTERSVRSADRMVAWRQDAKYAWQTLRRSPGFAVVSLLTLALAIGANTAIFSVARAVLLKPLPFGTPSALMRVFESWPQNPSAHTPLSPPNFVDYRTQQHTFTDLAALQQWSVTWRPENADPAILTALAVSASMFNVLQVGALHGRTFSPGDDTPGNTFKAIVSHGFWQRALGGDVARIGGRITLNDRAYDLIGVMPRGFTVGANEDVWTPLDLSDEIAHATVTRKQHWVHAIGRLKPGIAIDAARADLRTISRRLEVQYPEADSGRVAVLVPLHEVVAGDLRSPILLLQGAALMVLLIACANLANLTLSRTMGRRREMALRAALGASRARLIGQLLTESVLLSLVGGAIGVGLAVVATRLLLRLNPETLPAMFAAGLDSRVLLFSFVLSVATGVLFGLMPALDAARADLHDSLKEGGRGTSGGRGERVRRALVVVQVGLAVMLLVGAGLLLRSFGELTRVRMGFEPDHVLTAEITASGVRYDSAAAVNLLYDGVLGDIARSPGVVAVGAAMVLPTRGHMNTSVRVQGEPADEKNLPDLGYVSVRGDYFKAMHIPLLAGRGYDASDRPDGPKTAIINQTAAHRFFPKGNAIGGRIRIGPRPDTPWMTIVGVVGDIRDEGLDIETKPTLFANHVQEAWDRTLNIVIRTAGDPDAATHVLRSAVKAADPGLALREVRSLDQVVGSSLAARRFALGLAACFAGVALLLAAVGIYGVLAYMVTTRTREFGVRLALGATTVNVVLLVLRQGLGWSLFGLALGIGGAIVAGRLLSGMLFGVSATDVTTYLVVATGSVIVVVVACIVPAARATRVDPLESIRAE